MRIVLTLLVVFLLTSPLQAQTNLQTISLTGAYDIQVPRFWRVPNDIRQYMPPAVRDYPYTGIYMTSRDSLIRIRTYSPYFLFARQLDGLYLDEILEWVIIDVFEGRAFDSERITVTEFGDYSGIGYRFEAVEAGTRFEYQFYMYEMRDGSLALGYMRPLQGFDISEIDASDLVHALGTITRRDNYVFADGTEFDISDTTWQIYDEIPTGIARVLLNNGSIILSIHHWPRYAAISGFENVRDFLAYIWSANYSAHGRYDRSSATHVRVSGFDGVFYPFDVATQNHLNMYERGTFVFELTTNNAYVTVDIMTSDRNSEYDDLYAIVDTFRPGNRLVCPLFANPGMTIRTEPTTSSAPVRRTADEVLIAQSQVRGGDGYIWFNIQEGWIRSDVIFYELNTCEGLPTRR